MLGLKKRALKQKQRTEKRTYIQFRTGNKGATWKRGVAQAQTHFNCDCRDGSIRQGFGVLPYCSESGVAVLTLHMSGVAGSFPTVMNTGQSEQAQEALFFVGGDGCVYVHNFLNDMQSRKVMVGDDARMYVLDAEQGRIYHIFAGKKGAYCTLDGGGSFIVIDKVASYGAEVCGGRFFYAPDPDTVRFSTKFRPFDFVLGVDGGGELCMPSALGGVIGMETVGNDLYVFGQKGILRYRVSANAEEFERFEIAYCGGRIFKGSTVRIGGEIVFLAEDGAYRLQGDDVSRLCDELELSIARNGDECRSGRYEDTAVIEYTMAATSGKTKRVCAVLPLDGTDGFLAETPSGLCGNEYVNVDGAMCRLTKDGDTSYLKEKAYFTTETTDFGVAKRKTLTAITFFGKGEGAVIVRSELGEREYPISIVNGRGEVRLCEKGETFNFVIKPYMGASFEGMRIRFCYASA